MDVDGTPGANSMPGRIDFDTTPDGSDTPLLRLRIDNAGNVGINISAPQNTLNVGGDINFTGLIYGNGSQLTGLTLTETDPLWSGNLSLVYFRSNPDSYWNATFALFNKTYADTLYSTIAEPLWSANQSLVYLTSNPDKYWNATFALFNETYADTLYLQNLVDDTSPQLGGYLDTNGSNIGATDDEIENVYVGTNTRIYFGDGQESSIYFDGSTLVFRVN